MGNSAANDCPYKNITAYLTPGQTTAKVLWVDGHSIELPEGAYRVTKEHNYKICVYYVIVTSKWLKVKNEIGPI